MSKLRLSNKRYILIFTILFFFYFERKLIDKKDDELNNITFKLDQIEHDKTVIK